MSRKAYFEGEYDFVSITTSDTTTYTGEDTLFKLYVNGSAGDIKVVNKNGDTITYAAVGARETITGAFTKVFATDTTATGILGAKRISN